MKGPTSVFCVCCGADCLWLVPFSVFRVGLLGTCGRHNNPASGMVRPTTKTHTVCDVTACDAAYGCLGRSEGADQAS